jgi:transcription initiation factor TFIIE subunit alpha
MQTIQVGLLKDLIRTIAGKGTEAIVDVLEKEKSVNEFKIAEKLKLTINQTRNILYKLSNQDIVSFTRKKDEKKGWYIYFWTLNTQKALERLIHFKKKELYDLEHQVKSKENKHFYICPSDNLEFTDETAINHDFICPECGQLLQLATFDKRIQELGGKIEIVKKELIIVDKELDTIKAEKLKQLEKEILKKKQQKARQRKRARAKKKAEKPKAKKPKARKKKTKKAKKTKKKIKKGKKKKK